MFDLLTNTAWPMATPVPYSFFHIAFAGLGVISAIAAARFLAHKLDGRRFYRVLFLCGFFLAVFEMYKQLFLYYVVNGKAYDWWYFPFQLCSLPMYFCLLLPLVHSEKLRLVFCTFMQDFNLLGGFMALIVPEGFLHPYVTLTCHGFIWHILLIFIGFFISFSGKSERGSMGYMKTLPIFGICCIIASIINVLTGPGSYTDMFYISPYYPSSQVVFHEIALKCGVMTGNIAYLLSICIGGYLCHTGIGFDFSKSR